MQKPMFMLPTPYCHELFIQRDVLRAAFVIFSKCDIVYFRLLSVDDVVIGYCVTVWTYFVLLLYFLDFYFVAGYNWL